MDRIVHEILGIHQLVEFKVGPHPLVAAYCNICGCIKTGNKLYYDGTYYQKTIKDIDEIKQYIDKHIEQIKKSIHNRTEIQKYINQGLQIDIVDYIKQDEAVLKNYETIEKYQLIKTKLINIHDQKQKCKYD